MVAQTPCEFIQDDFTIPYVPGSAVASGAVIVLGSTLVTISKLDIDANKLGDLSIAGLFKVPKVTGAISAFAKLYWDADADPLGGDAGTGAFTTNSALGPFAGWADKDGAVEAAETVNLILCSADNPTSVARADLGQDDLAPYGLDLETWRVTATGAMLGAAAGTPAGAFGLTYGTHGTNSPLIVGEAASGNVKTNKMRRQFTLPPEYVAGQTVTLRVRAIEAVGAATVSTTIDAEVFEADLAGGISADLCTTAAIDVTDTIGNKDFTITPTGLAAGDVLDIELTGVTTDTGGTVGTVLTISDVRLLLDIKG